MALLEDFLAWKQSAAAGQRFCYHARGFVAIDTTLNTPESRELAIVRRAVIDAYLTGNFELVQERHGYGEYSYFIVRRRQRNTEARVWHRSEKSLPSSRPHRPAA